MIVTDVIWMKAIMENRIIEKYIEKIAKYHIFLILIAHIRVSKNTRRNTGEKIKHRGRKK